MSQITTVSTSAGGTPQTAAGTWTVRAPTQQRIFERRLYLRVPIGGADQVVVDEAETRLDAQFQTIVSDARPGASLSSSGDALIVALDAPRRVTRVDLAAGMAAGDPHTLELYRLDEQRLADDPTERVGVDTATGRVALSADAFTDMRFAMRLVRNSTGVYESLTPAKLAALLVQTRPTGPRIGLVPAADEGEQAPLVFWQAAGELAPGAPAGQVHAGQELAATVQRQVDRALAAARDQLAAATIAQLPAHIDIALVIQSDAPCDLSITTLKLVYRLARESFPGGEPKQVLRFSGASASTQRLELQLPAGATIHTAMLRTVASFTAEQPATQATATPGPELEPAQRQGLRLGPGVWGAQPFAPQQAVTAVGCAIAVMALAAPAEITLELQEDWHGQPSGRSLAAATAVVGRAGVATWVRLPFAEPVVVPAQRHWLVVQAARGVALCLLDAGELPARALERDERGAAWRERQVFDGLALLHRLLAAPVRTVAGSGATPPAPFTLAVADEQVSGALQSGDSHSFDLTAALQHSLADGPAVGGLVYVPLAFTALARGLLTVYPPRVEYSP